VLADAVGFRDLVQWGHSVADAPAGVMVAYGTCELCRRPIYRLARCEMLDDDGSCAHAALLDSRAP